MEKLQDLLKSFWIETKGDKKLYKVVNGEKGFEFWYLPYIGAKLEKTWELQDESLISKSFGFISWLVDNDKIDIEKLESLNFNDVLYLRTVYYGMLMILSIQDNPIEFLVSILK